jgi:hypothetical protein
LFGDYAAYRAKTCNTCGSVVVGGTKVPSTLRPPDETSGVPPAKAGEGQVSPGACAEEVDVEAVDIGTGESSRMARLKSARLPRPHVALHRRGAATLWQSQGGKASAH